MWRTVDALLRAALASAAIAATTIAGVGTIRLDAALQVIDAARAARSADAERRSTTR
jgi:hypothetical protein